MSIGTAGMGQTKLASMLEAQVNLVVGFMLSMVVWAVVGPLFGYEVTLVDNLGITACFTVFSFLRAYCLRRLFNWLHIRTVKRRQA
jgi:low affinity Fe/Cu permease